MQDVIIAAPSAAPIHDAVLQEWSLTDQDGITYFGNTSGECYRLAAEGARIEAAHWRHNRHWSDAPVHYQDNEGEIQSCQTTS